MNEKQATSLRILDAASKRFLHYGYQKTTMAEIARDLSMSTGNLYRFYASKLDIAEELALKSENNEFYYLEQILTQNISATEKIRKFIFKLFKDTFDQLNENKKINEIAQVILNERPEYGLRRLAREREILIKIFCEGVLNGEFAENNNKEDLMLAFQCATMRFRIIALPYLHDFEKIAHELDLVLDLLIAGLKYKQD